MRKQAKNRILASVISLLLALSLVASIPFAKAQATTGVATAASTQQELADNVQDGLILHAWNWSYSTIQSHLQEIKDAGYTTIQTSPVQQPKDYSASYTGVSDNWWKLYQPVSYSIAQNSWLGNANDLTNLCAAAKEKGMKIICDIVVNHLANDGSATGLNSQVAQYESTVYNNYSTYIHPFVSCSDGSIESVVRGNIGMPDVNTANSYIQGRVISLLEQCVDCGVDGFRFDAAKHIETQDDQQWASNFWNNVLGTTKSYAQSTKSKDLYVYGEILNTPGDGRSWSSYTSLMSITDNKTGNGVRKNVVNGDASGAAASGYNSGQSASKLVLWAESHDTYEESGNSDVFYSSKNVSTDKINKAWAIVASRADATSLYFARPDQATMGQCGSTQYKTTEVSEVNHFHNHFIGAKEYLSSSDGLVMNERYFTKGATTGGAVLVNVSGTSKSVSNMTVNCLGDGTYKDQISGATFTVSNGKISGQIGSTGIAVLYNTTVELTPANTVNPTSTTFSTDTLDITLGLTNATSGTYQIGTDGDVVSYTNDTVISIGADMQDGDSKTVYLTATDGTKTTTASETYKKSEVSTVSVYFTNNKNWSQVYAYYWGGENPSSAWPGNKMTKVETNSANQDVYTIEVPTDVKGIIFTNGSGEKTVDITSGISENAGFAINESSSTPYSVTTYTYGNVTPVTTITVYFTNNYSWSTVNAYYWGSSSSTTTWPGKAMTYVGENEYGQGVYSISIPSDVTGLIFNSGSGGAQTADITSGIANGVGFYISGGSASGYTVGSYTY